MSLVSDFVFKVKRAETPFYARLNRLARRVLTLDVPLPEFVLPLYRGLFRLVTALRRQFRWLWVQIWKKPVARSLCASAGVRLRIEKIPSIRGNVQVHLGDDVHISGRLGIAGGRVFRESELRVGNRVFIGDRVTFMVCRQILIEDDVLIAQGCYIADNSAHPLDAARRIAGAAPDPQDVRPVRIGRGAWLGREAMVLPGVTIGEGAVIGAASVVTKDVPPYTVWVGNPARQVRVLDPALEPKPA